MSTQVFFLLLFLIFWSNINIELLVLPLRFQPNLSLSSQNCTKDTYGYLWSIPALEFILQPNVGKTSMGPRNVPSCPHTPSVKSIFYPGYFSIIPLTFPPSPTSTGCLEAQLHHQLAQAPDISNGGTTHTAVMNIVLC